MERLTAARLRRVLAVSNSLLVAVVAQGQTPPPAAPAVTAPTQAPSTTAAPPVAAVATNAVGLQSVDLIPLRAYVGGNPLKHGNVIPGSDRVQLNGQALVPGQDYILDCVAGVIYLKVTQNLGDSLLVYYNYDPKASNAPAFTGFQINLLPGASMMMGMGLAERDGTGQVISSNVFGWKNSFNFGAKSSASGLMLVADQQGAAAQSQYGMASSGSPSGGYSNPSSTGQQTHFVLESYKSALMGGAMSFDVQNISRNFANFNAVHAAGYSDADVTRLQAEKGLDRMGISFAGLKFGGLSMDDTLKTVKDDNGSITWKNLAATQGGLKLAYSSQKVDDGFGRFNDLSEADKAQLLKERGMSRENFAAQFTAKTGNFNFQSQEITDDVLKNGIHREDLNFDSARFKADFGSEKVDTYFLRAGSLTAAEAGQYAREVGTDRHWISFSGAPDAKSKPFTFSQTDLTSPTGTFRERDAAYTGKSWSIQHIDIGGTSGFAAMGALQDAASKDYVTKIGSAFGATAAPAAGDTAAFLAGPTLRRDYTSVATDFYKIWHVKFDTLGLKGATDTGYSTDASVTDGRLVAAFHRQAFGDSLTEAAGLMPLEQARLGVLPGLRREDFTFTDQLSKVTKIGFSNMNADSRIGSADRTTLQYTTKGFDITASQRKVDTGFTTAGQLVDPEASVLASLEGFRQRDLKFTWNKLPNIVLTGEAQDALDEATGEMKSLSNYKLVWNFDKTTQLAVIDTASIDRNPMVDVLRSEMRQVSFSKDFGKYGKFAFLDELDVDEGVQATLPTSHKDYLSYETKLSSSTSFRAEGTSTSFEDGTNQGISAETLSTQLTKRLGVSVTSAQVTGDSKAPGPGKNDYGVWYDLGNGVRVSYGYAHQYDDGNGSAGTAFSVGKVPATPPATPATPMTPGAFGPITLAAGYGSTQFENAGAANHTNAFSNVALATVKPIKFGPFTNMKFSLGVDSASDYATWSKNNRSADMSGQLGSNTFSLDYNSQLASLGIEGIDRGFKFQTSQSQKAKLVATISYKVRTLPGDVDYVIRDFNVTAKPFKNFEITNQLQTNPEVATAGVFLGSVPQAARSDKWNVNFHQSTDTTFGGTYQELINEASNLRTTTGGLTLKLFQKSGSPVSIFYGQEDTIGGGIPHRLTSRYSFEFDQHPGPTQTFSIFVGNVSYDYNNPNSLNRENWTARLDYQLRF